MFLKIYKQETRTIIKQFNFLKIKNINKKNRKRKLKTLSNESLTDRRHMDYMPTFCQWC